MSLKYLHLLFIDLKSFVIKLATRLHARLEKGMDCKKYCPEAALACR